MRRGEVWSLRDSAYASKARPVVVVQSDDIALFDSVILCLFTTYDAEVFPNRVKVEPDSSNNLSKVSYVMTDKLVTVDRSLLGYRIGRLDDETMREVGAQLARVLGLQPSPDDAESR